VGVAKEYIGNGVLDVLSGSAELTTLRQYGVEVQEKWRQAAALSKNPLAS